MVLNPLWFLLAMHSATASPVMIETCLPIWVTIIDEKSQLERDFTGCADGTLGWSEPEGFAHDPAIYQTESERYPDSTTRTVGDQIEVRFRPHDSSQPLAVAVAIGAAKTVDGFRVRVLSGGPPTVRIKATATAREIGRALAAAQNTTVIGAEYLGDQRITLNFQSKPAASLWSLLGDVSEVNARLWSDENTVRVWPLAPSAPEAKPGLRMPTPSAQAMPNLQAVYAMQGAADSACASTPDDCIVAHQQLLAYTDSFAPIVGDVRLSSMMTIATAHAANGHRDTLLQADRDLAAEVQKRKPALSTTLPYLQEAINLPAPATTAALLSIASATIEAMPAQQVRLSAITLEALKLQLDAQRSEAFERLQALQDRYLKLDLGVEGVAATALPIDLGDERLTQARLSVGRAASRVADALLEREQWADAIYALAIATTGTDDPGQISLTEVRLVRALIRLRQLDVAFTVLERINCGDNLPICEIENDLRPALLLALNRLADARSSWTETAGCPLRNASDIALLDALEGKNPALPARGTDCAPRGTLAELVLDALPDATGYWQHWLYAESYLLRYAARGEETDRTAARQHFDAALAATSDKDQRAILTARIARLTAATVGQLNPVETGRVATPRG